MWEASFQEVSDDVAKAIAEIARIRHEVLCKPGEDEECPGRFAENQQYIDMLKGRTEILNLLVESSKILEEAQRKNSAQHTCVAHFLDVCTLLALHADVKHMINRSADAESLKAAKLCKAMHGTIEAHKAVLQRGTRSRHPVDGSAQGQHGGASRHALEMRNCCAT